MWYILYVVLVWVDVFFSCVIHTLSWYKKTDDLGSLADPIWTQNAPILRSSFWDAQQDFCYLSLKLISSHLKKCHPKRQGSCSNYQYSGAALVSRRVRFFFLKLESPFLPWDNIKSWGQCALATCLKHLRHHLHSNSKHILYWKLTYPWLDVGRLRSFWFVRFSGDSLIFVCVCNNLMFMITHTYIYIYCLIHREGERERESPCDVCFKKSDLATHLLWKFEAVHRFFQYWTFGTVKGAPFSPRKPQDKGFLAWLEPLPGVLKVCFVMPPPALASEGLKFKGSPKKDVISPWWWLLLGGKSRCRCSAP